MCTKQHPRQLNETPRPVTPELKVFDFFDFSRLNEMELWASPLLKKGHFWNLL
jgi:hypothetical protein